MSMSPIQSSHTPPMSAVLAAATAIRKNNGGSPAHQALLHTQIPNVGAGPIRNLKHLHKLKQMFLGAHKTKGKKHSPKARRQHLQRHMDKLTHDLMTRLGRMMNRHRNQGCGKTQGNTQAGTAQSGSDYSFLDDPKMSMSDKIELFLQKIIKDSEEKMEKLMRDYDNMGKSTTASTSTGKSKKKKKGHRWAMFCSTALKVCGVVATGVASVYGTPATGAAVGTAFAGLSKTVDKAVDKKYGDTGNTTGNTTAQTAEDKTKIDSDRRMVFFKIQKLQTAVQEMITFFSTKLKKEADLNNTLIRNMA